MLLKAKYIGLVALLLALAGCNLNRGDSESSTPVSNTLSAVTPFTTKSATSESIQTTASGSPVPQVTATQLVPSNLLPPSPDPAETGVFDFESSFDAPIADWIATNDEIISRGYENGSYYLGITSPDGTRWGYTVGPGGTEVRDIVVEVDMRISQDTGDAAFGTFCRRTDGENYYYFLVNNVGQVQIGRMADNNRTPLTEWIPGVQATSQFNRIRTGCVGNVLWIEGNGAVLARVEDTAYTSGSFGLFGVNNRAGTARADYDNLVAVGR